ncbi:MAG: DnaB-like helicase C-terminal domain-containing protein [Bacteroidia bacterium]
MEEKRPVLPLSHIIKSTLSQTGLLSKLDSLNTGFDDLDELLSGGLQKGNICIVAARPGMGKSSFLIGLMHQFVFKQNKPSYFISLKSSELDFLRYLLVYQSSNSVFIEPFEWTDSMKADVNQFKEYEENNKLGFCSLRKFEADELFHQVFMAAVKNEAEVVIIDSLQLMHEFGKYNHVTREKQLGMVLKKLKQLAIELNILIIIGSDLSRSVEKRSASFRPMLSDLKDSGWIEEIADQVLFIYRPSCYGFSEWEDGSSTYQEAEICVAKNKLGRLDSVILSYDEELFKFDNLNRMQPISYVPNERKSEFTNPF